MSKVVVNKRELRRAGPGRWQPTERREQIDANLSCVINVREAVQPRSANRALVTSPMSTWSFPVREAKNAP